MALIKKYDCEKHVYILSGRDNVLEKLQKNYPEILRGCGAGDGRWNIVERAIKYGCQKLQFFKEAYNPEMVTKAHDHGIICNIFKSDTVEKTEACLDMGIDVIMTDNYLEIAQIVAKREKYVTY